MNKVYFSNSAEVKKQPPPQPEIEPVRINVRKVLRDSLSNR